MLTLLTEVAEGGTTDVLDQFPKPEFRSSSGFGDSSLDFELRVWIRNPDRRFEVRNNLNHAIDEAFRKHGVEIPFPQRDLHLRSSDVSLSGGPGS